MTYVGDVQPILVAECGACHGNGGIVHSAAADYDDAVAFADDIVDEIQAGDMPPACNGAPGSGGACVSTEDFATIQQWIEDGTPEE